MEFKDEDNHLAFILITTILFLGVANYMLIFNYLDVPKMSNSHFVNIDIPNKYYPVKQNFSWDISFTDKKISNIENIIIWIFFLWGFMRGIDLFRFLENYKKENSLSNRLGEK